MKHKKIGWWWLLCAVLSFHALSTKGQQAALLQFDFYGDVIQCRLPSQINISFPEHISTEAIEAFYNQLNAAEDDSLVAKLLDYKAKRNLDDWLYYQLIRKTAQQISPKEKNYYRYTLYKWYLLSKSGFETMLSSYHEKLLFYVRSDEQVYNIPTRIEQGRAFVCLNYHDYQNGIDVETQLFKSIPFRFKEAIKPFTYLVNHMPDLNTDKYSEKEIRFRYRENEFQFRIRINPTIPQLFKNYPVVDYAYYFNRPMSKETYGSLIPALKSKLKGLRPREGVDFLMHFTRYGFLFETDTQVFGTEKRLSPEETLLYQQSDCEDRAALFFFLVKEIYNLPMLVLSYPEHVTIAVGFDKPFGNTINYEGRKYTVCEPTPQSTTLAIGELSPKLRHLEYLVAYHYDPQHP